MKCDVVRPEFRRVVPEAVEIETIAEDLRLAEGPVWHPEQQALYFTEILEGIIWRWRPGSRREVFFRPSGHANGMALDAQGRLVVAGWSARSIWRVTPGGQVETLATTYRGKRINTPNDVVVAGDGSILWTDPSSALLVPGMAGEDVQRYLDFHGVFRLGPDGGVRLLAGDFAHPNGLCFSPDGSVLYVDDTERGHVRAFGVAPDGSLGEGRVFYELVGDEPGVADGLKTDVEGNVYVTGPAGIHVTDRQGRLLGRMHLPARVTNMGWGGPDGRWLHIMSFTAAFRVHLGIAGAAGPGWSW